MNKLQTGWLYTLTGAVSAVSLAACMPASKPYNIVYIMTDDHTAQMMSCYDNRYIETPNLDRIANDGVRSTVRNKPFPKYCAKTAIRRLL